MEGKLEQGTLLAFIDESYVSDGVYYQGAMVVSPNQAMAIRNNLDFIARDLSECGIPADVEFHGSEIFQANGHWRELHGLPDRRVSTYRQVLTAVAEVGGTYLFQGIHTSLLKSQYGPRAHHPHQLSLQYLLERVNQIGLDKNQLVKLIADKVEDHSSHEAQMRRFQIEGTPGWNRSTYSRIDFPIAWRDSKSMRSLQAIDMATFIVRRHREHIEKHSKRKKEVARLYELVMARTSYINVWPKG